MPSILPWPSLTNDTIVKQAMDPAPDLNSLTAATLNFDPFQIQNWATPSAESEKWILHQRPFVNWSDTADHHNPGWPQFSPYMQAQAASLGWNTPYPGFPCDAASSQFEDLTSGYCVWNFRNPNPTTEQPAVSECDAKTSEDLKTKFAKCAKLISSKENLEAFKDFEFEVISVKNLKTGNFNTAYRCLYNNCGKTMDRTWNLLDHVRMHKGIKPFKWGVCGKAFTQRGNMAKHAKLHKTKSIEKRRKFTCTYCGKKYTEKYNLAVSGCSQHTFAYCEGTSLGSSISQGHQPTKILSS